MADKYDVVIIGGGPGGYNCAIRCGQLGLKVACIESRKTLGGTCLNVGCIPSKALLHSSELYAHIPALADMGIAAGSLSLDLSAMMNHKDKTVGELTKGIEFLFKKNKVTHIAGTAKITAPGSVQVALSGGGEQTFSAGNIVIATGSEPAGLPGIDIDEDRIVSSTGALSRARSPNNCLSSGAVLSGWSLAQSGPGLARR